MARAAGGEDGALVAVIADEDTITGFLLAGVGDVDLRKRSNFLVVDGKTTARQVEAAFKDFTGREDVAIVLVSQPIANMIRHVIANHNKVGFISCCMRARGRAGIVAQAQAPHVCQCWRWQGRCRRVGMQHARPSPAAAWPLLPRLTPHHPCSPQAIPAVLEIPSKDSPYDPNQDSLLNRVKHLLGLA